MRSSARLLAASLSASLVVLGISLTGDTPAVQVEDSFVATTSDGWTIGNSLIHYSIGKTNSSLGMRAIEQPESGHLWQRATGPDAFVRVNGQVVNIGSPETSFLRADTREWSGGVRLDMAYRFGALDITRSYVCYPASSII